MEQITSLQNKWVKYIKSLEQKKYREREKVFLLEGIRLLEEALEISWPLKIVAYSSKLLDSSRGKELFRSLEEKAIPLVQLTEEVLEKISDTQTPQGILAVACQREYSWESFNSSHLLLVLVDGVQDPGNLGTIIRTADAAGAHGVLLTKGTVDLYSPKTIRSTMGSLFHLPIIRVEDLHQCLAELKARQVKIIVGDLAAQEYCFQEDYNQSIAICVGNEGSGPSQILKEKADKLVKIPMSGLAESLNVGIAAGILLYEANRQRVTEIPL